jgi:transposase
MYLDPKSAYWRAMKELEVILKAIGGEIKWVQAADILGVTARTIRRKRQIYLEHGIGGLIDKRRDKTSARRVPFETVQMVLRLYLEKYFDFNVKHFHEHLARDHALAYSYTWTKNLLQEAGYVKRKKGRGGHRKRRERRPVFGQMIDLDGSEHRWLSLVPGEKQVLLLAVDDATGRNLAARLVRGETTKACLCIIREVVEKWGIPAQLYTDRNSVYWTTKKRGQKVDPDCLTQFGKVMTDLGIEMIPSYSPQGRGRGERWNATWQGRLISELRLAGINSMDLANEYISHVFLPEMNERFSMEAKEEGTAFVEASGADLNAIFSIRHTGRRVDNDNTVHVNNLTLQIPKSAYRSHFVKCEVDVLEHLEGGYSVVWKKRVIGKYDAVGTEMGLSLFPNREVVEKKGGSSRLHPPLLRPSVSARVAPQHCPIPSQDKEA